MQFQTAAPHIYSRHIAPGEHNSLQALADIVPPDSKVLDLGCGTGALGTWLTVHKRCVVDGFTLSEAEATQAAPHYRRVVIGNLETADIAALFEPHAYDFIVCADVLEHLSHPDKTLADCHALLAPNGKLLVSVPNVAYAGLIAELLDGKFGYRDEGLLDRTHLRFFTRSTLLATLAHNRWLPTDVTPIRRTVLDSEFNVAFEALPPAVSRYLLGAPDSATYQFVVTCQATQEVCTLPDNLKQPAPFALQPEFTTELFLRDANGYSQRTKLTARGIVGNTHQTIRFQIPAHPTGWAALRLDPADRPGFLTLHQIKLLNDQSETLWQYPSGSSLPLQPPTSHHHIHWDLPISTLPGQTLILLGEDPWFELPVNEALLRGTTHANTVLEVQLGWPMSADHMVLAHTLGQLHESHQRDKTKFEAEQTAANQTLNQLRLQCSALTTTATDLGSDIDSLRQTLHQTDEELHLALHERQRLATENQQLGSNLAQMQAHLTWIENSTVFKVTRPLVRMKMALTGQPTSVQQAAPAPAPPPLAQYVDVIVPVYKGLADTRRCILSALANPCQTPFRLIVLNDASPEPEVTQWLRDVAQTDPRITLLENPENLGFVGTVNRGMAHSDANDVVLLNSDTEVSNDWLDRLRQTAYSDTKVGTVTPLSNNATICSYPRFCQPNPLVNGHTTASLDALCAATNPGVAIDVPTGVGFCMYIRRDCLSAVGLFDVPNFGKGYGEENDFCRRAHAAGWRNLHALDTFVLHAGGVSFGDSKSARELAAMETLRRLYPDYETEVMRFIQADPAQPYRHALDLARLTQSPRPKVLAVTHDRAGGTLRHVKELALTLQQQAQFLVISPVPCGRAALELLGESEGFKLEFNMESEFDDLVHLLRAVGVSLVHYHHLLGHHPRIQALPEQLGVPFDFTAHDHYTYCPQISLTRASNRYCGETGVAQCNACLQQSPAPGGVDIGTWRRNHQRFLHDTRFILAPSQDTAQRMQRFMPNATVRLVPHADLPATFPPVTPPAGVAGAPLKVVVIGALSAIKGADLLEEVATLALKGKAPIEFHLVGYAYRSLKTRPRSHLTVHGEYSEAELPGMLEWLQPDLVWFPALWPETYSYTLSACLQAGLPVVAPELGAFPDRLAQRAWSWVQPWDQPPTDWLVFFQHIHTAHFATGVPPAVPSLGAITTARTTASWDYSQHYLPQAGTPHGSHATPPSADWLHAHRPGQVPPGLQALGSGVRRQTLSVLLRLRSAPLLRGMAQAIPLRWQTRLKSWLVR